MLHKCTRVYNCIHLFIYMTVLSFHIFPSYMQFTCKINILYANTLTFTLLLDLLVLPILQLSMVLITSVLHKRFKL